MKCPLIKVDKYHDGKETQVIHADCLGTDCAWYSDEYEQCDPTGFLPDIIALGNTLGHLVDILRRERTVFHCHYCGTAAEIWPAHLHEVPDGWTRKEQLDGKHVWICDRCFEED